MMVTFNQAIDANDGRRLLEVTNDFFGSVAPLHYGCKLSLARPSPRPIAQRRVSVGADVQGRTAERLQSV
jgi:hypothetical protein